MGCSACLDSNALDSNYLNKYIDTDDFREEDFPHFQYNFYNKSIKNIKKVYEERIKEGNNVIIKIHKIFVSINYAKHNTTNIRIEIEKKDGQIVKKHLTKTTFNYECTLEELKTLLEVYNMKFNIDSRQWYHLKPSTDIYIKAENIHNNLYKIFRMFYDKDISNLKMKKTIKIGNSNKYSESIYSNINPGDVVKKYNELKSIYYDNKPEIYYYGENSKKTARNENSKINENSRKNKNYSNHERYSNHQSYSDNNNNYSYYDNHSNHSNDENQSNHNNNESQKEESNRSGVMRDNSYNIIGRIDSNGNIRDNSFNQIGRFDSGGIIRDESYNEVARFDDNGVFRDEDGEIGRVNDDGVVHDNSGNQLGHISDDGDVKDNEGNIIGHAEGMTDEEAAYMYFFHQ